MEEGGKEGNGQDLERTVAVTGDESRSRRTPRPAASSVPAADSANTTAGTMSAASSSVAQAASGPVARTKLIARRYANANEFQERNGQLIPLAPAFRETRPGGISVDVLWVDGGTKASHQRSALVAAAGIATAEGHQIRGWFSARVKTVLEQSATAQDIVHSPTASNQNHADIVSKPLVRFADDWEEDNKRDAVRVIAKDLAEVFREHGNHLPKPEQPAPDVGSAEAPQ